MIVRTFGGQIGKQNSMPISLYPYLCRFGCLCQNEVMVKRKSSRSSAEQNEDSERINFEDALGDVERIVRQLESGEAGLGESLDLYAVGVQRLKECHQLLNAAERQISLLSGFDADGNPITEPFGDSPDETLEAKQQARTGRRKAPAPQADDNGRNSVTRRNDEEVQDDKPSSVDDSPGLF